jgi:hypothetical protein
MSGTQFSTSPAGPGTLEAPAPSPASGPVQPSWSPSMAALADPRRKSPALACVLSLMPGLGQIYVGYTTRGFVHAITVASLITILNLDGMDETQPLFAIFLAFFWLFNIIDAGRRASLYNYALSGLAQIDLPEDLRAGGLRGSILGGVVLVAIGGIVLSHTIFGASLAWVADWWPVAPILLGFYLIARAIADRRERR